MSRRSSLTFCSSPLLWLAICFAAGIVFGSSFPVSTALSLGACLLAAVLAFVLSGKMSLLVISLAFVSAGVVSHQVELESIRPDRIKAIYDRGIVPSGSPVEVEGTLIRRPEASPDGQVLLISASRLRYHGEENAVTGTVRLLLPLAGEANAEAQDVSLSYGSHIRVACELEREDAYLNPGVITHREVLDRSGVDATGVIKSSLLLEHLSDESVFLPLAWLYDQRAKIITSFRQHLGPSTAGVMTASLLGNRQFLDRSTADIFREGGTFHILVISGLHITFLGALVLALVRCVTRNRWLQLNATGGILWGYALAVGTDTPVVRAAVMFTAVLFAYALHRSSALQNVLGLCALLLLAWQPSSIFDPSFQLTFLSVLSISSIGYPLLERLRMIGTWMPRPAHPFPPQVPEWLRRSCESIYWNPTAWEIESGRNIWTARIFKRPYLAKYLAGTLQAAGRWIFEGLMISLIAQVCMLPLAVVYFHRFTFGSVFFNLWVGFWLAIESFCAVVGALFSNLTGSLAFPFFLLADGANAVMLSFPGMFTGLGTRVAEYPHFGQLFYFFHFIPILIIAAALARWDPFELLHGPLVKPSWLVLGAIVASVLISGIIVFHPFSEPFPDGQMHVDFLDVGQGDSAFITFPAGETMLVDGGGRMSYGARESDEAEPFVRDVRGIGESVVSEVLWQKGYSSVDLVVATHADADHMQGLIDVVHNFKVRNAMVGGTPEADPEFVQFRSALHEKGVSVELVREGDRFSLSGVSIEVLHPKGDAPDVSDNDHSIVLRLVFGNRNIILTGDIEENAEQQLIAGHLIGPTDVIKVAHHGSRTSSTLPFVNLTRPQLAVISVGQRSPFGHPHAEVIDRWLSSGAVVIKTGDKGMISVSTDGTALNVSTYIR